VTGCRALDPAAARGGGTTEIANTVTAAAGDLPALVTAFDDALGQVLKQLVEWTLVTGEAAGGSS
jgi:hypothetical protein